MIINMINAIGLSGVAASGKDVFFDRLDEISRGAGGLRRANGEKLKFFRVAFADVLKWDLREFILENFGFDLLKATREEKNLVRPILFSYGMVKRQVSFGRYCTDAAHDLIWRTRRSHPNWIPVITDVRYYEYGGDEIKFIKEDLNGVVIHISRRDQNGELILPINSAEAENDPKIKEAADYRVEWGSFMKDEGIDNAVFQECKDIVRKALCDLSIAKQA